MVKVMVVDDECLVTTQLSKCISRLGYDVVTPATSGEESIDLARQIRPDLIFMDILMPGKYDGIAAAEIIKREMDIPVVFVSGYSDDDLLQRAKQVDPLGYIVKPFAEAEVKAVLELALYRREMERRLKEREKSVEERSELLPNIVCELNADLRVTYLNQAGFETLGYSPADLDAPLTASSLINPDDQPVAIKAISDSFLKGITSENEFRIVRSDGSSVSVLGQCAPINKGEDTVGVRCSLTNLTEMRRFGEQLAIDNQLAAMSTLVGGIANDFNNFLAIIIGYMELARIDSPPQAIIHRHLGQAMDACWSAKHLTQRLLFLSHGGAPNIKSSNLTELIKDTVALVPGGPNIRWKYCLEDNLWPVDVDPKQVSQALCNVIGNAQQAMENGGVINIVAGNYLVGVRPRNESPFLPEGKYVRICIADQGDGIPEEHLPRIFDPYFSTKPRGTRKGMGLGLTITHSIIKRHHGHIRVESVPGAGTSVYIYLPAAQMPSG
ncbi:MAG: response regulator [Deltaproteobacteria bacterium]|nr:response regulator [Deltaproteobacteria bacterium]